MAPRGDLVADDVLDMIDGALGTQVRLTLRRGTGELQVSVTRGPVTWPVVEGRMLGDGIAYLRMYGFAGGAPTQIRNPVAQLLQAQPRGLVLDLRSNPGGARPGMLTLLGLFLPQGTKIFQTIDRAGRATSIQTTSEPIAPALPLTVLVNRHTRSAAEVAAAALQETGRASFVGERTAGFAEGSQLFGLSDGSGAVIAYERVLTAQGREIEGRGVNPDVEFPHDLAADRDLLLERAVQLLLQRLKE